MRPTTYDPIESATANNNAAEVTTTDKSIDLFSGAGAMTPTIESLLAPLMYGSDGPAIGSIVGSEPTPAAAQQTPPQAPLSPEEQAKQLLLEELKKCHIDMSGDYAVDECLLSIGGVPACSRKDIVAVKAKQKHGKSNFVGILMAALLGGQWQTVRREADHVRILYIDTEMKPCDTVKLCRKALRMAKQDERANDNRFNAYNLRKMSTEECRATLPLLLENVPTDIVFIDGIVDLIRDFNDPEESQRLVRELIDLAEQFNCCIVCVLHTNKATDDHNMRGHLGTMLAQKGQNVFECKKEKVKDTKEEVVIVTCVDHRNAPIPDLCFAFDNDGCPINGDALRERVESQKKTGKQQRAKQKTDDTFALRREEVKSLLQQAGGSMHKSELLIRIKESQTPGLKDVNSRSTVNSLFNKLNDNLFEEDDMKVCKLKDE